MVQERSDFDMRISNAEKKLEGIRPKVRDYDLIWQHCITALTKHYIVHIITR